MKRGALSSCLIPISLAFLICKMGIKVCTYPGLGVGLTQMEGERGFRWLIDQLLMPGLVWEWGKGVR